MITESPGEWWTHTMVELDSTWLSQADWNAALLAAAGLAAE